MVCDMYSPHVALIDPMEGAGNRGLVHDVSSKCCDEGVDYRECHSLHVFHEAPFFAVVPASTGELDFVVTLWDGVNFDLFACPNIERQNCPPG
jgi:hypothetical protein